MSDQEFIFAPPTVSVGFEIRPVDVALNSFLLVNQTDITSGLGEWVERTRRILSDDRLEANAIVFDVLLKGIDPQEPLEDFPSYIRYVESLDPVKIRDAIVDGFYSYCEYYDGIQETTSPQAMLSDKQEFLRVIQMTIGDKHLKKGFDFDLGIYAKAHPLLTDPTALHAYIVEHMHTMWEYHLREEWEQKLPMLEESVEAFSQLDYTGMTGLEAARTVTGRDLSNVWPNIDTAQRIVFMPSPHIGPFVTHYPMDDVSYVIYGARVPEGVQAKSSLLSRSELLTRLNALADDTRLAILELLTREEELFAQDIMTRLDLSQSSASRHLRQLSATGFLVEKRREVAKFYTLNQERVEDTLSALRLFMRPKS
jgi:DNA-binding transcriptional ArsR family regulator